MKRLTILTLTVFSVAIIVFSTAYACGGTANASAWVHANSAGASAYISAYGVKRGGYALTCTGNPSRAMAFTGSTSASLSSYFSQRVAVSASASVGGSCRGGGGFQKYDSDSAGP